MRETLYLYLRGTTLDQIVPYALVQPAMGVRVQFADLDTVLAHAAGRRLVVFVPGADVRLASVRVPARQPQKVLQAAPYALEDQLAEDVDTLHFALGPRQPDGSHPVAITAKARMEAWLAPFRERGLAPEALSPETLCLPETGDGYWSALADADHVTVRTGPYAGFCCVPDDLATCLQLTDPEAHLTLRILVSRENNQDFTRLSRPLELLPGYPDPLDVFIRHYRPDTGINLLQGAYSQRESWKRLLQPWRVAAMLAGAWIALTLVQEGIQTFRLGRELQAQQAHNLQRFQELFPGEKRIVDLAVQAEQQLTLLQSGSTQRGFFNLLEVLSAALTANPGLNLQSFQFREGALYLNLTGHDLQALETLRSWFAGRREATLEVQAANASGNEVQIRLKITLA